MAETLIKVDLNQSAYENEQVHNRWHPDVPMACWVNPGDDFVLETYDWTGGFIKNNDSADDVRDIDLSIVHFLSGPVGVKGAEPGDLLVVDLLDIGTKADSQWGFNGFFSKQNGGGFLTDHFPLAQKSIWDFNGLFTKSRHIPGVEYAGLIHPGLIGCLPDPKMLAAWNEREQELIDTDPTRVPGLANPPFAATAHMGKLTGDAKAKAAAEGARTVPPREPHLLARRVEGDREPVGPGDHILREVADAGRVLRERLGRSRFVSLRFAVAEWDRDGLALARFELANDELFVLEVGVVALRDAADAEERDGPLVGDRRFEEERLTGGDFVVGGVGFELHLHGDRRGEGIDRRVRPIDAELAEFGADLRDLFRADLLDDRLRGAELVGAGPHRDF